MTIFYGKQNREADIKGINYIFLYLFETFVNEKLHLSLIQSIRKCKRRTTHNMEANISFLICYKLYK